MRCRRRGARRAARRRGLPPRCRLRPRGRRGGQHPGQRPGHAQRRRPGQQRGCPAHPPHQLHRRRRGKVERRVHRADVRRGPGPRPPLLRDQVRGREDRPRGVEGALPRLPTGDCHRLVGHWRGGQDRRPVLRLQDHAAAARGTSQLGAADRSRGLRPEHRPGRLRGAVDRPYRAPGGAGRAHVPHRRPEAAVAGRHAQRVRPRRSRAGVHDALRSPGDLDGPGRRDQGDRQDPRRPAPPRAGPGGYPYSSDRARLHEQPCPLHRHRVAARARGQRHLLPPAAHLRLEDLGLLGAAPRPRAAQRAQPAQGPRGQDRGHHRRLQRHRRGDGQGPGPQRRPPDAGLPYQGEARRAQGGRSRPRAARPGSIRPTSPTPTPAAR